MTIQSFIVQSAVQGQLYLSTRHLLTLNVWETKLMKAYGRGKVCVFCLLSDEITTGSWCGEMVAVLL